MIAMGQSNIENFLSKVNQDPALIERLKNAATIEAVIQLAGEIGVTLSQEDVLAARAEASALISDAELETVSGGMMNVQSGLAVTCQANCLIGPTGWMGCKRE